MKCHELFFLGKACFCQPKEERYIIWILVILNTYLTLCIAVTCKFRLELMKTWIID